MRPGRIDPMGTLESNIRGTYHLLEACRLYKPNEIRSIVIASSDKAYGDCDDLPCSEDAPLAARNPYDVSKSCAEHALALLQTQHVLRRDKNGGGRPGLRDARHGSMWT